MGCLSCTCIPSINSDLLFNFPEFTTVSKATLDIICSSAFGYTSDSLHNPHNELAEAYEVLTGSQNGVQTSSPLHANRKCKQSYTRPGPCRIHRHCVYSWCCALPLLTLGDSTSQESSLAGSLSPVRSPYAELNTRTCANCVNSDTIPALLGSMERIRAVAAVMLSQKMAAAAAVQEDGEAQRDIMSLLVRARLSEARGAFKAGAGPVYAMSDTAMMDQVVRA